MKKTTDTMRRVRSRVKFLDAALCDSNGNPVRPLYINSWNERSKPVGVIIK